MIFFFSSRRRHTRFDCDWSSDVCSSDLGRTNGAGAFWLTSGAGMEFGSTDALAGMTGAGLFEIGRASCRERGVDLGGRRIIKKKKKPHQTISLRVKTRQQTEITSDQPAP